MSSTHFARSKKAVAGLTLVVACAAAAAFLIAARKPTQTQSDIAAPPEVAVNSVPAMPAPGKKVAAKTVTSAKPSAKAPSVSKAPSATEKPATIATYEGPAKTQAVESDTKVPVQDSAKGAMPASPAVTIAGCLERDGDSFRLKDTTGKDTPKSRSWKSGFLKKGPPRIEVIDASNRLKLRDHVGQRVSVTGTLNDREMQARSLLRVATTCE